MSRGGWVFNVDQSPQPFRGEAIIEAFGSLDFEGWRASIAIEGRQYFNVSESRDGAMLGLIELLAETVAPCL
jgi:hypothetical protein